jgi:hypothetical protein
MALTVGTAMNSSNTSAAGDKNNSGGTIALALERTSTRGAVDWLAINVSDACRARAATRSIKCLLCRGQEENPRHNPHR